MKKIGIYGGTFNPIHVGHLMVAQRAYEEYHLDQIVFLPNGNPPHKSGRTILDTHHRAEMVKMAIKDHPAFVFSDMELKNQRFSYTSETLTRFCDSMPDNIFYFIVGADSLDYMDRWHEPQEIFSRATILAAPRGNFNSDKMQLKTQELERRFHATVELLHLPNVEISSNWIRDAVHDGYSIHYYVTEEVENYIKENHLYLEED